MELLFDRLLVALDDWLNSCDRRDDLRDLFSRDFFSQKDDYFQDEEESRDEDLEDPGKHERLNLSENGFLSA
jgi:hypothetical protein